MTTLRRAVWLKGLIEECERAGAVFKGAPGTWAQPERGRSGGEGTTRAEAVAGDRAQARQHMSAKLARGAGRALLQWVLRCVVEGTMESTSYVRGQD